MFGFSSVKRIAKRVCNMNRCERPKRQALLSHARCQSNGPFPQHAPAGSGGQTKRRLDVKLSRSAAITILAVLYCSLTVTANAQTGSSTSPADTVTASGCFLLIKQQAAVPARDRGVLARLDVQPGIIVEKADSLAALETTEAELSLEAAKIDLSIAERELADTLKPEIAAAAVEEARERVAEAKAELAVAKANAASDHAIRIAENAVSLAQEEYDRSVSAREAFRSSVSDFEILKLRLVRDEKELRVKEAAHQRDVAMLTADSKQAAVGQYQRAIERLELEADAAERALKTAALDVKRLSVAVALAEEQLSKRSIRAPFPGLVVEKLREVGEWVEAGEAVFRLVRLDQLLVEGFVPASLASQRLVNSPVRVRVETGDRVVEADGRVVFVSPEVDRVNLEVKVRAEIANRDLRLRPGQPATMTIFPEG